MFLYFKRAKARIIKDRELYVYMRDKAEDLSLGKTTEVELKEDSILQNVMKTIDEEKKLQDTLKSFTNISSEIGDVRAISCCAFQPIEKPPIIVTGSWTGFCKIWNTTTQKESLQLCGKVYFILRSFLKKKTFIG